MNIKERFLDWCDTDIRYQNYKYDLSVAECFLYGIAYSIIIICCIALGLIATATVPIWAVPYLIYKSRKLKIEKENEENVGS